MNTARRVAAVSTFALVFCGVPVEDRPPHEAQPSGSIETAVPGVGMVLGTSKEQCLEGGGPFRVGGAMYPPGTLRRDDAPIREAAQREGLHGLMILELVIEEDGRVGQARVLKGPPQLTEIARETVMHWPFTRPICAEKNVKAIFNVSIAY